MSLLNVYKQYLNNEVTEEYVAEQFGMTLKRFRFSKTRWEGRFESLLAVLDNIRVDQMDRDSAAEALGVSVREINQLMKKWDVTRPIKEYRVTREKSQLKWQIRKKYALDFISGSMELEDAAIYADCSTRQIRRWAVDLLKKHFDMPWGDLRFLSSERRARLVNEIEEAEQLEMREQQSLHAISTGRRSLETEALERIMTKKKEKECSLKTSP